MAKSRLSAACLTALFIAVCGIWPAAGMLPGIGRAQGTEENRTLAAFPSVSKAGDLERFPGGFEAWLNDHMPFRTELIRGQSSMEIGLFGEIPSDKVIFGKEKPWLFNRSDDGEPLQTYKRMNLFTDSELDRITANLAEMSADFSDAGIRLVLMISPDKEQIYGEDYMPDSVLRLDGPGRTEQLIAALSRDLPELCVVYPAERLREEKASRQVYYESDTHWNRIGAGIACEELLEALEGESFPDRYHFREGTPKYGDLQKLVQLGREYDSTEYEVVEAPSARVDTAQEDAQGEVVRERSTCPSGLPFSIYLSGDSFRWNLARFLQDGVRDVTVGSRYYLDLEDVVLQEPDVFVYMIAERYLHELDRIPGYNTQAMTIE